MKPNIQETANVILSHIEASSPCSFAYVIDWAINQGYDDHMMPAIHLLQYEKKIELSCNDNEIIVELT